MSLSQSRLLLWFGALCYDAGYVDDHGGKLVHMISVDLGGWPLVFVRPSICLSPDLPPIPWEVEALVDGRPFGGWGAAVPPFEASRGHTAGSGSRCRCVCFVKYAVLPIFVSALALRCCRQFVFAFGCTMLPYGRPQVRR